MGGCRRDEKKDHGSVTSDGPGTTKPRGAEKRGKNPKGEVQTNDPQLGSDCGGNERGCCG